MTSARLVAANGIARSMPGYSSTTQTRPSRCMTVIPTSGKVSAQRGWVGSVTVIVSRDSAAVESGAFWRDGLRQAEVARLAQPEGAHPLGEQPFHAGARGILLAEF